jgi:hypothetical protein
MPASTTAVARANVAAAGAPLPLAPPRSGLRRRRAAALALAVAAAAVLIAVTLAVRRPAPSKGLTNMVWGSYSGPREYGSQKPNTNMPTNMPTTMAIFSRIGVIFAPPRIWISKAEYEYGHEYVYIRQTLAPRVCRIHPYAWPCRIHPESRAFWRAYSYAAFALHNRGATYDATTIFFRPLPAPPLPLHACMPAPSADRKRGDRVGGRS